MNFIDLEFKCNFIFLISALLITLYQLCSSIMVTYSFQVYGILKHI